MRKPEFSTRSDTNQAVQAQKMARGWKFRIWGFESGICLMIAPVPVHGLSITFKR